MISLLKFIDGPWEKVRGYLRIDLETIQAAINKRWAATFGDSNVLVTTAGGTGLTPPWVVGDILYVNTTTSLARLADVAVGSVLVSGGVAVAPLWSANPTVTTLTATTSITQGGALALGIISTDGIVAKNTTAATAGVPVQQSPRIRLRSNVWNTTVVAASNTDDMWIESVPVSGLTPSGLLKVASSLNGGAATYPFTISSAGIVTSLSTVVSGSNVQVATGAFLYFNGRGAIGSPADGQFNLTIGATTTGVGIDANTDAILKVRTRAQTGYAVVDASKYRTSGGATLGNVLRGNGTDFVDAPLALVDLNAGLDYTGVQSWTPTDASGASLVFTSVSATYIRIGKLVQIQLDLTFPATVSGAGAEFGGLPFTSGSVNSGLSIGFTTYSTSVSYLIAAGTTNIFVYTIGGLVVLNSALSLKRIVLSGSYISV